MDRRLMGRDDHSGVAGEVLDRVAVQVVSPTSGPGAGGRWVCGDDLAVGLGGVAPGAVGAGDAGGQLGGDWSAKLRRGRTPRCSVTAASGRR
jgi:hypothetical protein